MFRFSTGHQFGTVMEAGGAFDLAIGTGIGASVEMIVVRIMSVMLAIVAIFVPIAASFAAPPFPFSPAVIFFISRMSGCLHGQQTTSRGSNCSQSDSAIHGFPLYA
jgi:hypothetical protein